MRLISLERYMAPRKRELKKDLMKVCDFIKPC
jgi:hypothetical protein